MKDFVLGCVFGGKSESGFLNPKTDFAFFFFSLKSKNRSWICWIHTSVRFFWSNLNPDFWFRFVIWAVFWEWIQKNFIWQAVFHANLLVLFAVLFLSWFRIIGNSGMILLLIFWKLFVKQADKHEQVKIASFAYQHFFFTLHNQFLDFLFFRSWKIHMILDHKSNFGFPPPQKKKQP